MKCERVYWLIVRGFMKDERGFEVMRRWFRYGIGWVASEQLWIHVYVCPSVCHKRFSSLPKLFGVPIGRKEDKQRIPNNFVLFGNCRHEFSGFLSTVLFL